MDSHIRFNLNDVNQKQCCAMDNMVAEIEQGTFKPWKMEVVKGSSQKDFQSGSVFIWDSPCLAEKRLYFVFAAHHKQTVPYASIDVLESVGRYIQEFCIAIRNRLMSEDHPQANQLRETPFDASILHVVKLSEWLRDSSYEGRYFPERRQLTMGHSKYVRAVTDANQVQHILDGVNSKMQVMQELVKRSCLKNDHDRLVKVAMPLGDVYCAILAEQERSDFVFMARTQGVVCCIMLGKADGAIDTTFESPFSYGMLCWVHCNMVTPYTCNLPQPLEQMQHFMRQAAEFAGPVYTATYESSFEKYDISFFKHKGMRRQLPCGMNLCMPSSYGLLVPLAKYLQARYVDDDQHPSESSDAPPKRKKLCVQE